MHCPASYLPPAARLRLLTIVVCPPSRRVRLLIAHCAVAIAMIAASCTNSDRDTSESPDCAADRQAAHDLRTRLSRLETELATARESCGSQAISATREATQGTATPANTATFTPSPYLTVTPEPPPTPDALPVASRITPRRNFSIGPLSINIKQLGQKRQWLFDRYGYTYHYQDADKDSMFVYVDFDITTKEQEPTLPPLYAYHLDASGIALIGMLDTRFYRWEDFATYLGNYHDSANDFSKRDTVKFTAGIQIKTDILKKGTVFVGMSKTPCMTRENERFRNPPVYYSRSACIASLQHRIDPDILLSSFEPVYLSSHERAASARKPKAKAKR